MYLRKLSMFRTNFIDILLFNLVETVFRRFEAIVYTIIFSRIKIMIKKQFDTAQGQTSEEGENIIFHC